MRALLILIGAGSFIYLAIVAFFYFRQEQFIFFPDSRPFEECRGRERTPLEPIKFEASGRHLHYLFRQAEQTEGAIIVFHGNAGTACDRLFYAEIFRDQPYDVILAEYPGYAGLPGAPSETALLEDGFALTQHIRGTLPAGAPLILLGESLGSGVATHVASRTAIEGLILISPYTSVSALASRMMSWLPISWILRHSFRADLWAKAVQSPVLILHGRRDSVIPFAFGEAQSQNFSNLRAFVALPNAGHNDWLDLDGPLALAPLHSFVESFLKR